MLTTMASATIIVIPINPHVFRGLQIFSLFIVTSHRLLAGY